MIEIHSEIQTFNNLNGAQLKSQEIIGVKNIEQANNQSKSQKVGNFIINYDKLLGQGSFSKVYQGFDAKNNRMEVAIKVIPKNMLNPQLKFLVDNQIKILRLINHENIVKCYEIFQNEKSIFIAMEICHQGDLQSKIDKDGHFSQNEAISIIKGVFDGLAYLSSLNIVHRDIKVANIFMQNNIPKIADFGFAVHNRQNKQFQDISIGSPIYMSPQGIKHNVYGPKTDVWAFGIFIYELVHGRTPYSHCTKQKQLKYNISSPLNWNSFKSDLSYSLKQLMSKCLEVNYEKRITFQKLKQCDIFFQTKLSKVSSIRSIEANKLNFAANKKQFTPFFKKHQLIPQSQYYQTSHFQPSNKRQMLSRQSDTPQFKSRVQLNDIQVVDMIKIQTQSLEEKLKHRNNFKIQQKSIKPNRVFKQQIYSLQKKGLKMYENKVKNIKARQIYIEDQNSRYQQRMNQKIFKHSNREHSINLLQRQQRQNEGKKVKRTIKLKTQVYEPKHYGSNNYLQENRYSFKNQKRLQKTFDLNKYQHKTFSFIQQEKFPLRSKLIKNNQTLERYQIQQKQTRQSLKNKSKKYQQNRQQNNPIRVAHKKHSNLYTSKNLNIYTPQHNQNENKLFISVKEEYLMSYQKRKQFTLTLRLQFPDQNIYCYLYFIHFTRLIYKLSCNLQQKSTLQKIRNVYSKFCIDVLECLIQKIDLYLTKQKKQSNNNKTVNAKDKDKQSQSMQSLKQIYQTIRKYINQYSVEFNYSHLKCHGNKQLQIQQANICLQNEIRKIFSDQIRNNSSLKIIRLLYLTSIYQYHYSYVVKKYFIPQQTSKYWFQYNMQNLIKQIQKDIQISNTSINMDTYLKLKKKILQRKI